MLRTFVEADEHNIELDLSRISEPAAVVLLGRLASTMLQMFGTCTFVVDEQRKVRTVNQLNVYIDQGEARPPTGVEPRFVRPIITNRKPQFVAIHPKDGSIWEVEFPRLEQGNEAPQDGAPTENENG